MGKQRAGSQVERAVADVEEIRVPVELVVRNPDRLLALGERDDVLDVVGITAGLDELKRRLVPLFVRQRGVLDPQGVAEILDSPNSTGAIVHSPATTVPVDELLPILDVLDAVTYLSSQSASEPDVVQRHGPPQVEQTVAVGFTRGCQWRDVDGRFVAMPAVEVLGCPAPVGRVDRVLEIRPMRLPFFTAQTALHCEFTDERLLPGPAQPDECADQGHVGPRVVALEDVGLASPEDVEVRAYPVPEFDDLRCGCRWRRWRVRPRCAVRCRLPRRPRARPLGFNAGDKFVEFILPWLDGSRKPETKGMTGNREVATSPIDLDAPGAFAFGNLTVDQNMDTGSRYA